MKAIIPAAGLGTRFMPVTKSIPKEMLPVLDKPVIQYIVEEAVAAGVDECIIVTNENKTEIPDHFQRNLALEDELRGLGKDAYADTIEAAGNLRVSYVYQHQPLGLGHAVYCASGATADESFYVMLGDVLVPENTVLPLMKSVSDEHGGASVIAVIAVDRSEVDRFGIIAGEWIGEAPGQPQGTSDTPGAVWRVASLVEKPAVDEAPSRLAIFGRYLLTSRVQDLLQHGTPGHGGEIQLTDALDVLLEEEEVYALVIDPDEGFDTGTVPNLIATNVKMALRDERYAEALKLQLGIQDLT